MRGGDSPGSTVAGRREAAWPRFEEVATEASRIAHYQAGKLAEGDEAGFVAQTARSAASQVLARANASVPAAASRRGRGARYARVLRGPEPCGWCFALAAMGFDYSSAEAASHSHRGCRCLVVPGDADGAIEGYDLGGIKRRYRELADACGPGAAAEKVVRFAELHDPGWLYDGRAVGPDYSDNPRSSYGRLLTAGDYSPSNIVDRGNEWRDLFVHDMLARSGIVATPHGSADLDVTIAGELWEVKSPDGVSLRAIEKGPRKASRQFSERGLGKARVILSTRYFKGAEGAVRERVLMEMERHGIDEVLLVGADGRIDYFA